jgi:5-methylcytosine-specific restriction endonuclease McrA
MIKVRCSHPGCKLLINKGEGGYCANHQAPKPKFNENKLRYGRKEYKTNRDRILTLRPFCQKCWAEGVLVKGTADHIISMAEGGDDSIENMQVLCLACNAAKKDKTIRYPVYDTSIHKPGEHF